MADESVLNTAGNGVPDEDTTDAKAVKDAGTKLADLAVGNARAEVVTATKPKPTPITKLPTSVQDLKYTYKMNHKKRGMALVINNLHFDPSTGMSDRVGTDMDASALCRVFRNLEFEVKLFKDLSRRNMLKLMMEAAQVDHKDSDCFACVILSHGEEGEIYGRDGKIALEDLVASFKGDKCPSLAGKPKLFFFQACRGSMLDSGVELTDAEPAGDGADEPDAVRHRIPTEADFLMAYSVVSGYFSWRNSARGSWFIQSLCEVLERYGTEMEMMRVMTRVNHKVAYDYESNAAKEYMTRKKQIPCIVSMLTKDLFFTPKSG